MSTKPHRVKSLLNASKRDLILRALLEIGTVRGAALASQVDRSSVYATMRADPLFAQAIAEAKALGIEAAKDEVYDRAMDRLDKASATLLMFIVKQADPSYRESYRSPDDLDKLVPIRDVLEAIKSEPSDA